MKLNKTKLICLCIALCSVLAVSGTMAYLQDTDHDVNVMTTANVYIDQLEYERVVDADGNYVKDENDQYQLQPFTQFKPLLPAVGDPFAIGYGPLQTWEQIGVSEGGGYFFAEELKNSLDKVVVVKNTGNTSAYVRTLIAIEAPQGFNDDLYHLVSNFDAYAKDEWIYVNIKGVRYVVNCFTYNDELAANAVTAPSLHQLALDSAATNEDIALLGPTLEMLVLSQAAQASGFENADAALNTAFGPVTADNIVLWFTGIDSTPVKSLAELRDALAKGGNVTLTDDIIITPDQLDNTIASIGVGLYVNEDTVLNLNGYSIIFQGQAATNALLVVQDAHLTIVGQGGLTQQDDDSYLMWARGEAQIDLMDGTYETYPPDCTVFYASGNSADSYSTINVYGGSFISGDPSNEQDNANVMNHGIGRINYYGGSFNWHPDSAKQGDDANYINVAPGYEVVENNGIYTVVAK